MSIMMNVNDDDGDDSGVWAPVACLLVVGFMFFVAAALVLWVAAR